MRNAIGGLLLVPLLTGFAMAELRHRYSFNDGTARDTVGNADGVAVNGPKIKDGELVFDPVINDGTNSDPQKGQYVKLPGDLLSHRSWTVEAWTTYRGGKPWQRIVDFGNSVKTACDEKAQNGIGDKGNRPADQQRAANDLSDIFGEAPSNTDDERNDANEQNRATENDAWRGRGFLAIMHNKHGNLVGQCSIASWGDDADTDFCGARQGLTPHREHHVVYTHDPDLREQKLYLDGKLIATSLARVDARDTTWNNSYIGRSQFTRDPFYNGRLNELRIYDHALSREDVQAHAEAGPEGEVE